MSNTPNFSSILDEAPTEVERPKPVPVGTYLTIVQGPWIQGKSSKKGTPFIEFPLRFITACDDVDEEDLQESGGLEGKTIKATFYYDEGDPKSLYRLDEFHEHCGIDLADGQSRKMRNDAVINAEVLVVIRHEPSQDGQRIDAKLARTASAE